MIPVNRPFLPRRERYNQFVEQIYDRGLLTNYGPLVQQLEEKLKSYLGVKNLICVSSGAVALQLCYKVMKLKGDVVTTPFSFAATASTLAWEGLNPIFTDVDSCTFNIDPDEIEKNITPGTSAILPVHVFGNPCEVERIAEIADAHKIKIIYDAAHSFGSKIEKTNESSASILNYGDASVLSLHATKLFHTIEGGAIITSDKRLAQTIRNTINFGLQSGKIENTIATNAKMNEFEAAMGLCVLENIDLIMARRRKIWETYRSELLSSARLRDSFSFQIWNEKGSNNHAYAPVLFKNEDTLLKVKDCLSKKGISTRRYFYPSLDTLPYGQWAPNVRQCKNSREIAGKILALPLYADLDDSELEYIINEIKTAVG